LNTTTNPNNNKHPKTGVSKWDGKWSQVGTGGGIKLGRVGVPSWDGCLQGGHDAPPHVRPAFLWKPLHRPDDVSVGSQRRPVQRHLARFSHRGLREEYVMLDLVFSRLDENRIMDRGDNLDAGVRG